MNNNPIPSSPLKELVERIDAFLLAPHDIQVDQLLCLVRYEVVKAALRPELPHDVEIGGLIERLREHAHVISQYVPEDGENGELMAKAATTLEALKGRVGVLEAGLQLASNRLRMAAINAAPEGKREYYDYSEWADEAQALLNSGGAQETLAQPNEKEDDC